MTSTAPTGATTLEGRLLVHRRRVPSWLTASVGGLVGATALAMTVPHEGVAGLVWALCAAPAMLGLRRLWPRRARWVDAQLSLGPGRLEVRGEEKRTLRARHVKALSTASHGRGAIVAVSVRGEPAPLLFEVGAGAQAERVCQSLAVGSHGLGVLRWPLRRSASALPIGVPSLSALALLVTSLLLPLAMRMGEKPLVVMSMLVMGGSLMLALLDEVRGHEGITLDLTPHGIDLSSTGIGWSLVPYHCIEQVSTEHGLELRLTPPHPTIRLAPEQLGQIDPVELAHIAEQLRTASQRARGLGPDRPDADERLGSLQRGHDESTRAWLQRLDAQASRLRDGAYRDEGYRTADLWQALDDHDAQADLRLGAARVLLRVQPEEARRRVEILADEQRDPSARHAFTYINDDHELDELAHRLDRCGLWMSEDERRTMRR